MLQAWLGASNTSTLGSCLNRSHPRVNILEPKRDWHLHRRWGDIQHSYFKVEIRDVTAEWCTKYRSRILSLRDWPEGASHYPSTLKLHAFKQKCSQGHFGITQRREFVHYDSGIRNPAGNLFEVQRLCRLDDTNCRSPSLRSLSTYTLAWRPWRLSLIHIWRCRRAI